MSFGKAKPPIAPTPPPAPNLEDAANKTADNRRRRLAAGGRNATSFMGRVMSEAASKAGPTKTLTGLQG